MPDWSDTLANRRNGAVAGFTGKDTPLAPADTAPAAEGTDIVADGKGGFELQPPGTYALLAEAINTVAAAGATQTLPAPATATTHDVTLTANCTFTFPAAAAGKTITVVLRQGGAGSYLATWDAAVKWPNDIVPSLQTTVGHLDVFQFFSLGTYWRGVPVGAWSI